MIIPFEKGVAFEIAIPMVDKDFPESFKTGLSPTLTAEYFDTAWASLTIADSFTERAATGVYVLSVTAAEANHDYIWMKVTGTDAADTFIVFRESSGLSSTFVLGPLTVTTGSPLLEQTGSPIAVFQKAAKTLVLTVLDGSGVAVDMSGMAVRFVIETRAAPPAQLLEISQPAITITGGDNNIANVPLTVANMTQTAALYRWLLWGDDEVLLSGKFTILPSSE